MTHNTLLIQLVIVAGVLVTEWVLLVDAESSRLFGLPHEHLVRQSLLLHLFNSKVFLFMILLILEERIPFNCVVHKDSDVLLGFTYSSRDQSKLVVDIRLEYLLLELVQVCHEFEHVLEHSSLEDGSLLLLVADAQYVEHDVKCVLVQFNRYLIAEYVEEAAKIRR